MCLAVRPCDETMSEPTSDPEGLNPREQGALAAWAGLIAPLIGIVLMVVISVAVDVVLGVVLGGLAVVVLVPIVHRVLRRRRTG